MMDCHPIAMSSIRIAVSPRPLATPLDPPSRGIPRCGEANEARFEERASRKNRALWPTRAAGPNPKGSISAAPGSVNKTEMLE
jgi:hypothetical protein